MNGNWPRTDTDVRNNRKGHENSYYNTSVCLAMKKLRGYRKDLNWTSGDEKCNVWEAKLQDGIHGRLNIKKEEEGKKKRT